MQFNYNLSHIQAISRINASSGIKGFCLFSHIPKLKVANCPSVNLLPERKCQIMTVTLNTRLKPGLLQPASAGCAKNMRWKSLRTGTKTKGILAPIPLEGKSFGFGSRWRKGLPRFESFTLSLPSEDKNLHRRLEKICLFKIITFLSLVCNCFFVLNAPSQTTSVLIHPVSMLLQSF